MPDAHRPSRTPSVPASLPRWPAGRVVFTGLAACGLIGLVALPGCGFGLGGGKSAGPAPAPPRTVQIQRGDFGVPQITAGDMEALAYGAAYAQAQESVCETADQLVTVRGERARWFGAEAGTLLGGQWLNNLQLDIFVRALMEDGELALAHRDTSADARALVEGYVAGYNRYLADHAAGSRTPLPAACAGQPWVRPMTVYDYRRLGELQARQAGSLPMLAAVLAARLPEAATAPPPPSVPASQAAAALARLHLNDAGLGGTAWALGADVAKGGGSLLLAQTHGPWSGSSRWRQMRLTVPGQLDVMGARMGPGVPVQVGFNADFAWSHTQSPARHATLFELTLVPGDPALYRVSGQAERMRARTVSVEVLRADGRLDTRLHTVWMTRYGPVVALPEAGLNWTARTAYALQDANAWNARGTETWLALGRARSIGEAQVALQRLGTPWMATVAADRHGDTLFQDASSVPAVDAAQLQRCAPSRPAAALWPAAGLVVLDGSRSDCAWRSDPGSASPGLMASSHLPTLERRDWVQNADDSYWLTNPALALGGLTPLAGAAEVPLQLRTRASLQMLRRAADDAAAGTVTGEAAAGTVTREAAAATVTGEAATATMTREADATVAGEAPVATATSEAALARLQAGFVDRRNPAALLVLDDLLAACNPPAAGVAVASAASAAGAAPAGAAPAAARQPPGTGRPARGQPATPPSAAARQACAVLAGWDRHDHADSRGAWLFRQWWRQARELPGLWRVPFDLKDPVNTPSGLNTADARLRSRLLALLEQAAAQVRAEGLELDVALGEVQQAPAAGGAIRLHGGDGFSGVLWRAQGPWDGAAQALGGTSLVFSVRLGPGGPMAQGVLLPGQWPEPSSPHAWDGLNAWASGDWPALAFQLRPQAAAAAASGPGPASAPRPSGAAPAVAGPAARGKSEVLTLTLPAAVAAVAPPLPKGLQPAALRAASAPAAAASAPAAPAPLPVPTIRFPPPGASAPATPGAPDSRGRGS